MKERALDAPIFTKQRAKTKKDDATEYKKKTRETTTPLLLSNTFAESPTFSYWPIPNIIIILVLLGGGVIIIVKTPTKFVCNWMSDLRVEELFEELGVKKSRKEKKSETQKEQRKVRYFKRYGCY
jgi:hypothetical protein